MSQPPAPSYQSSRVFVGRERELEELRVGLGEAVRGRGCLFLVAGEPGIGKTRLCDELAAKAETHGFQVFWGRCWEGGGAPPFWPWVQIVRAYMHGRPPETLAAQLGAGAADVAHMVPELLATLPDPPRAATVDEAARFRLFDATTTFLKNATDAQPLALLLDDIHAADVPSLLLLQFLARELGNARLVVVATFREAELLQREQVAELVGELGRSSDRISLRGLTIPEVELFLHNAVGVAYAGAPLARSWPAVAVALHEASAGNPFFVDALVRVLIREQGWDGSTEVSLDRLHIPGQVREAVRRHLRPLSAAARAVLKSAAVVGREFDRAVLVRAHSAPTLIEEALDEAVAARLLVERDRLRGRYGFRHALICETLYDDLPTFQRASLHRAVGEAIEALHAADLGPHLPAIAHHFVCAGTDAGAQKATDYCQRAGERALAQLAYEEASLHFIRALSALATAEDSDAILKCRLLLALGKSYRLSGAISEARTGFLEAAALARKLGSATLLAEAALGFVGPWSGELRSEQRPVLEEALVALGEQETVLRSTVLSRLALEIFDIYWPEHARATAMAEDALALARRLADPVALAEALVTMINVKGFLGHVDERLVLAAELTPVACGHLRPSDLARWGCLLESAVAFLEIGAVEEFERVTRELEEIAHGWQQPLPISNAITTTGMRALLEGRFDEAQRVVDELFTIASRLGLGVDVEANVQRFLLRREQGRLSEIVSSAETFASLRPVQVPAWKAAVALAYTDLGLVKEARSRFERLAAHDFTDVPTQRNWSTAMAHLAETCAALGDECRAAKLYELLSPYAHRFVVGGWISHCLGSVARYLGLVAYTMGRNDEAVRLFGDAIAANERIGARTWAAWSRYGCADALRSRNGPGDAARSLALLDEALTAADDIGMVRLAERARTMRDSLRSSGSSARDRGAPPIATRIESETANGEPETRSPKTALFRNEGHYWTITYGSDVVRLKDSKGVQYLAHLLREPGRELLAIDLVQGAGLGAQGSVKKEKSETNPGPGTPDPGLTLLDARAKHEYRQRWRELREELAAAEQLNDLGRVEKLKEEIDFLARQLNAAVDLYGKDRKVGAAAERARLMVTKRIKSVLKTLDTLHPPLAHHLRACVKTGYYCTYAPPPGDPVVWQT